LTNDLSMKLEQQVIAAGGKMCAENMDTRLLCPSQSFRVLQCILQCDIPSC
jgi:hypothetical protein